MSISAEYQFIPISSIPNYSLSISHSHAYFLAITSISVFDRIFMLVIFSIFSGRRSDLQLFVEEAVFLIEVVH